MVVEFNWTNWMSWWKLKGFHMMSWLKWVMGADGSWLMALLAKNLGCTMDGNVASRLIKLMAGKSVGMVKIPDSWLADDRAG